MDHAEFRAQFPVCERLAYLNAGTCGPLPRAAADALRRATEASLADGRAAAYYEALLETREELRSAYARVLGAADPQEVSVTTSTTEGIVRVLLGLDLRPGDEVLIATAEHPGLLGPLAAARDRLGLSVREVSLAEIASAVGERTRLVACSHVAWTGGEVAPSFSGLPPDVPVLLDGAQGAGAVPVDLGRLGCAFYAGSGQKWLCGPVGTGMLWVAPAWRDRLAAAGPGYLNLETPSAGLEAVPAPDGRAFDTLAPSLETMRAALAALDALDAFGWAQVHARARELAADLATALTEAGREVMPRGDASLVSWRSADAPAEAARLREHGVVVRDFPGLPIVRACVGAWNDQSDLGRLVDVASSS